MTRNFAILGAVFAFLGVGIGAFGAHALRATLMANGREGTFETAVQYQLIHALGLFVTAWATGEWPVRWTRWAGYSFAIGIVVFSGSLYILAIFNISIMGAITPIGGVCFLAGWACLGLAVWRGEAH